MQPRGFSSLKAGRLARPENLRHRRFSRSEGGFGREIVPAPLIEEISDLVAPRLEVKPLQGRPGLPARKPRRPESFHDLLTANLTSASLLYDFREHRIDISLDEIANVAFLHAVASALVSAVDRGLYIARRIYSGDEDDWPAMASPLRVYFVRPEIGIHDRNGPGGRVFEPDAATCGIGPAVKLLYSVLQRITELDAGGARSFLGRWRYSDISIYRRLWAAAARNAEAVTATEIREFLVALDDSDFWNLWVLAGIRRTAGSAIQRSRNLAHKR